MQFSVFVNRDKHYTTRRAVARHGVFGGRLERRLAGFGAGFGHHVNEFLH